MTLLTGEETVEYQREVKFTFYRDTNKQTVEREFRTFTALRDYLETFYPELLEATDDR